MLTQKIKSGHLVKGGGIIQREVGEEKTAEGKEREGDQVKDR